MKEKHLQNGSTSLINKTKSKITAILSLIIAILAIPASLLGIFKTSIYSSTIDTGVMLESFMAGTIAQDIISAVAGLALLILSVAFLKSLSKKVLIALLGLTGYFLYGYGLYVITGLYTSIYVVYLAIFTLSIFTLIWGLASFKSTRLENYSIPLALGRASGIFLSIIVVVFVVLWLVSLIPFSLQSMRPDFYGVYVMDLCIVMPSFAIIVFKAFRREPFSNILIGIALIVLFTLCLSLTIGESIAPVYNVIPDYGMIAIFSTLTFIGAILSIFYFIKLRKN